MDVEIIPCSVEHLEQLIEGADIFSDAYGLEVIDGYIAIIDLVRYRSEGELPYLPYSDALHQHENRYMPFAGALKYILTQMQTAQLWHPWLPYLFVFRPDQALVGFGGFKSVPNSLRTVEIGYSIAPNHQGSGLATSAGR